MRYHLDESRVRLVICHLRQTASSASACGDHPGQEFFNEIVGLADEFECRLVNHTLSLHWIMSDLSGKWRIWQDMILNHAVYIALEMVWAACRCAIDASAFRTLISYERNWLRETFGLPRQEPWIADGEPGWYDSWCRTGLSGVYLRGERNPMADLLA
ncbi:MAG: hypothetical protein AAF333_11745 [Planctomycetota bacterium]